MGPEIVSGAEAGMGPEAVSGADKRHSDQDGVGGAGGGAEVGVSPCSDSTSSSGLVLVAGVGLARTVCARCT
jgi:hypothetical protein